MSSISQKFTALPEDNFDVHVENEKDARRLLWLVNEIGETKLRASAAKRNKYYPESRLFISVLLKRFRLKVPPSVYTETSVPVYWVYVLVLRDHSAIKVGMTGGWPGRAYDFVKTANYAANFDNALLALFDARLSVAFCTSSKRKALDVEEEVKKTFASNSAPTPYDRGLISYGCGGHTEWFGYSAYQSIVQRLSVIGTEKSLLSSLVWDDHMKRSDAIGPV